MDVKFTVLNVHVLLCESIGGIYEFHYADYELCHFHSIVCLIDIYLFLGCLLSLLFIPCILPVVLMFPLLGLFIHMVNLSSIMFMCSSSSVWLQISLLITWY